MNLYSLVQGVWNLPVGIDSAAHFPCLARHNQMQSLRFGTSAFGWLLCIVQCDHCINGVHRSSFGWDGVHRSSFGWDGVHRSSPLLLPAQRSPLVSRWRSSLISFRLDLAFIARSFSVSTWRALFARALLGRCRHLVGRWIMLLFSCMHGSLCGRKICFLKCTLVTAVVQCYQWS